MMISITENVKLRKIKIEDQPKLMRLLELIYPPAYEHLWLHKNCSFYLNTFYSFENLKQELADLDAHYYFVNYNSDDVGILRFINKQSFLEKPEIKSTYLSRIYLSEKAQGKGVANQLFRWVEHIAKQKGDTLIWLKAMDTQRQALRFYEKQGYSSGAPTALDFELMHPHLRGMKVLYKSLV